MVFLKILSRFYFESGDPVRYTCIVIVLTWGVKAAAKPPRLRV